MMCSMTGFGRGEASATSGQAVVEIKTVNHRFLEIRTKVPSELNSLETAIEKCVRGRLARGYCTVHLFFMREDVGDVCISQRRLTNYVKQIKTVADDTSIHPSSLMALLSAAPDLFEVPSVTVSADIREASLRACHSALDSLIEMRQTEGVHMAEDVERRLDGIHNFTTEIQLQAAHMERDVFEKFRQRIHELISAHNSPDNSRIETEAALLAEKVDINEELNRLFSHIKQMKNVFNETGPVGRRMDFLIQEMGREANTIASKSVLADITHTIVSIKSELEKMRELIQNIE